MNIDVNALNQMSGNKIKINHGVLKGKVLKLHNGFKN